jgi:hypothetical protein
MGSYIDRRFFEMQEFIYHYNKAVLSQNKNFNAISQQSTLKTYCEQILPFKQRRDEKRVSDDMKEHLRKLGEIKDELLRSTFINTS